MKIPKQVLNSVNLQANKILRPQVEDGLRDIVDDIKKQMIEEFMNHPVTEEIMNGYNSENISNTLGGYGNLFSFIGFDFGDAPIMPIIDILEKTNVVFSRSGRNILTANITLPSAQDIFAKTPMPWASGRSWAKGIESGISGLGFYLNSYGKGNSNAGIQVESKMRGGRFKNVPYISALLNKYRVLFSKINYEQTNIKIS
jgi:hypothetical protein